MSGLCVLICVCVPVTNARNAISNDLKSKSISFFPIRVMLFNEFWRIGINKWPSVIATRDISTAQFEFLYLYTHEYVLV